MRKWWQKCPDAVFHWQRAVTANNQNGVNLGETVVVGWIDGGGWVLVEDVGNEAGGFACWLNGTRRLAVGASAHQMIHTRQDCEAAQGSSVVLSRQCHSDCSHRQ